MRLVLLHTHFDYLDGSTRFILEICRHLRLLGHSTSGVCLNSNRHVLSEYKDVENSLFSLDEPPARSMHFWLRLPLIRNKIRKVIREIRPDCVIANVFPAQYLLPDLPKIVKVWYCHEPSAYIYRSHSISNLPAKQRAFIKALKVLMASYDKRQVDRVNTIACNSHFTADMIWRTYRRKAVVVYPGVDTKRFRPISVKKAEAKILLCVGPLLKSKRLDLVLQAVKVVSSNRRDFRLVVAGDGSEYRNLSSLADTLGISHLTEFRRYVSEDELIKLYSEATAVVYPSLEEPFGLVPLEAMSCGTSVVACKSGGPSETIVDCETGFLVDPHDLKQLSNKLDILLSDSKLAVNLGHMSRKHMVRRFSWDRAAKEICRLSLSDEQFAA